MVGGGVVPQGQRPLFLSLSSRNTLVAVFDLCGEDDDGEVVVRLL